MRRRVTRRHTKGPAPAARIAFAACAEGVPDSGRQAVDVAASPAAVSASTGSYAFIQALHPSCDYRARRFARRLLSGVRRTDRMHTVVAAHDALRLQATTLDHSESVRFRKAGSGSCRGASGSDAGAAGHRLVDRAAAVERDLPIRSAFNHSLMCRSLCSTAIAWVRSKIVGLIGPAACGALIPRRVAHRLRA